MADSDVLFDQQKQYDQILPWILSDERLYAVFDCKGSGTGFIALTDKRLLFYDKAFLSRKKAITSVPYGKLTSVSSIDQGGWLKTGELVLKVGSDAFDFEFWKPETAQKAYQIIMRELLESEPK